MTNNQLRYVTIPMGEYEAMCARISRKENIQFTADELRLLLERGYPHFSSDPVKHLELSDKIYRMLIEVERNG